MSPRRMSTPHPRSFHTVVSHYERSKVNGGQRKRGIGASRKVNLLFTYVCACEEEKRTRVEQKGRKDKEGSGDERNEDVEGEKENLYS